jgi:hypothetical protein
MILFWICSGSPLSTTQLFAPPWSVGAATDRRVH